MSRLVAFGASAVFMLACGGSPTNSDLRDGALVVTGHVLDAAGSPVDSALVHISALSQGKPGGEFGCTGAYLVGDWIFFADQAGGFTGRLGLRTTSAPTCIVVFTMRFGDDQAWRDTAAVVARFTPVAPGVQPDTVRFELRFSP